MLENRSEKRITKMSIANLIWIPLIGGGLLLSNSVNAQSLTLNQAIEKATENNGNMKALNLKIEKLKTLQKASIGLDKTDIGVQYGQMNSFDNDFAFSVEQSFKFPTAYKHQKQLNELYVSNAENQILITQNDLIKEIKTTWYNLIYLNEQKELVEYEDVLWSDFNVDIRKKLQAGSIPVLDKINADTKLMQVKARLIENRNEIKTQELILQTLLNSKTKIQINNDSIVKRVFNLTDESISQNPKLKYLQNLIVSKEKEVAVSKSNYLPEFSVGYFNQSMIGNHTVNGVEQYYGGGQRFQAVNATISIPIFTKATKANVNASKIDKEIAQNNADYYQTNVENQYSIAVNNYTKSKVLLDYYENKTLAQADLIIENSNKSYESGNISTIEYTQMISSAMELKNKYLITLKNYNQSIINIEYLVGK